MTLKQLKFAVVLLVGLFLSVTIKLQSLDSGAQSLPPEPPEFITKSANYITNISIHAQAGRRYRISFKKECVECTNIVTSLSYSITTRDSVKNTKTYTIAFHCSECGEDFIDTFELPMKHTKVEAIITK